VGGFVPFRFVLRFGPKRRIPLIEHLFLALHWMAFVGLVVVSVTSIYPYYFRTGDAVGLLFAALALSAFPLKIGKVRSIGCLVLAILSGLVFIVSPSEDALFTTSSCVLLYILIVWIEMARQDQMRHNSAGAMA
jgi:hypothetical protein